ncbi:bifunctional phosphoribosyl-AMP cyclohydrolase/phosphoribosyl-ATP pyrophosphatase, partial [Clostridium perfringens]
MSEDMLKDLSLEQVSEHIRWDALGLVPAIVQDAQSKQVLMMAYM